jgi:hypothetical protein
VDAYSNYLIRLNSRGEVIKMEVKDKYDNTKRCANLHNLMECSSIAFLVRKEKCKWWIEEVGQGEQHCILDKCGWNKKYAESWIEDLKKNGVIKDGLLP